MGTNYYFHRRRGLRDFLAGRPAEVLHIGRSSAGWVFSLHIIPELGIHDLPDWRQLWKRGFILNEYRERISTAQMEKIITDRRGVRGQNDLLRHDIGRLCVKHGAGTWDCMQGEFS